MLKITEQGIDYEIQCGNDTVRSGMLRKSSGLIRKWRCKKKR